MKLRNKKTGEIVDNILEVANRLDNGKNTFTLAEINAEWEDYEEPKEYWYVDEDGEVWHHEVSKCEDRAARKSIGNYFETKEQAEKVVEKLKAWKRLKDKGFRFIDHIDRDSGQGMARYEWGGYIRLGEDLDLLFGGEE